MVEAVVLFLFDPSKNVKSIAQLQHQQPRKQMNKSFGVAKERFINNWQFIIPVLLCCITAILLACWKLSDPGLYYDEMLFVNAAVGGRGDIFMRYKLAGIPILLMNY